MRKKGLHLPSIQTQPPSRESTDSSLVCGFAMTPLEDSGLIIIWQEQTHYLQCFQNYSKFSKENLRVYL